MRALPVDSALLPTEEQVRSYERHGWFVTARILPDELLETARQAIRAHHSGHRDRSLPPGAGFADWRPGDGPGVRNNEFCSLQNDGIRALSLQPLLGAIAARLARTSAVRLFDDQAVYKPPAGAPESGGPAATTVGWHTDHSYWSTCTSERMLTAWIPLQDSDERSGTLYVADGSHRWPESEHVRGFKESELGRLGERLGRSVSPEEIIPLRLQAGQVSFHHMRTLHASAPNAGSAGRFAVAVHLQDTDNRHRDCAGKDGEPIVLPHDRLCRRGPGGRPDYGDPLVFPLLWPAAAEDRPGG